MSTWIDSWVFGSRQWLAWGATLWCLAVLFLLWSYRGSGLAWRLRALLIPLKALALALLAWVLLEPLRNETRPRVGENLFAVLIDSSESLDVTDAGGGNSGETARKLFEPAGSAWLSALEETFDVRRYRFGTRLRQISPQEGLAFDEKASRLSAALGAVQKRHAGQPLAGVLALTDGCVTDKAALLAMEKELVVPVYPVILRDDAPPPDLRIENVTVRETSFEDFPAEARVNVAGLGWEGRDVRLELLNAKDEAVEARDLRLSDDGSVQAEFRFRPPLNISDYQVRASLVPRAIPLPNAPAKVEATAANNTWRFSVDRSGGPYRILCVAGRPNWEYKFLNRAVAEDEQLSLVGLIRVAKREPKFDWRGRQGESSNPLFRGFDAESAEERERYDEPVLVRLGVTDASELQSGFPDDEEELFRYHAVILDDVEAEFFTRDQLLLLEQFVLRRGGGFLMLGGMESLSQGDYARTPVEQLLPVYLDASPDGESVPSDRWLKLSREGRHASWLRLRTTEEEEAKRLAAMPGFRVLHELPGLKPAAHLLAELEDPLGAVWPGIVTQRYGRGRSAVLALGDLWRWQLHSEEGAEDFPRAWRQMLRWLVTDVPGQVDVRVDTSHLVAGDAVKIDVRVFDKKYHPVVDPDIDVEIHPPEGEPFQVRVEPSESGSEGEFQASFVPQAAGAYRVRARAADSQGKPLGSAETGWASNPAMDEFRDLAPDRELLDRVARSTGGRVLAPEDLEDFVENLPSEKLPLTENVLVPLWHRTPVMLVIMGCLLLEWFVRRKRGLA